MKIIRIVSFIIWYRKKNFSSGKNRLSIFSALLAMCFENDHRKYVNEER